MDGGGARLGEVDGDAAGDILGLLKEQSLAALTKVLDVSSSADWGLAATESAHKCLLAVQMTLPGTLSSPYTCLVRS